MRPPGTSEHLERRRRRAIAMMRRGRSYRAIAAALRASLSSVVRWAQAYRTGGSEALRPRPAPGRPSRLTPAQTERLRRHLLKGPLAAGYSTNLWTLARIAKLIHTLFGIRYHPGHCWRVMRDQLGWTCQKPERRATQRKEAEIEHWKRQVWPHIKKRRSAGRPSRLSRRKWVPARPQP